MWPVMLIAKTGITTMPIVAELTDREVFAQPVALCSSHGAAADGSFTAQRMPRCPADEVSARTVASAAGILGSIPRARKHPLLMGES